MDAEMSSLVVKLIASILSPLVEWIKERIARSWYRRLKWIILDGEYRNDKFVFHLEAKLKVLAVGFFDGRIKCLEGKIKNTLRSPVSPGIGEQAATEDVQGVMEGINIHLITMSIDVPGVIVPSSYLINLSLNRKKFIGTNLALEPAADKGAVGWLKGEVTVRCTDKDS